ncbi:MAG: hypothetical protein Q7U75_03910, partial [Desulfobacterales bacterium]|nr:hypothetical protein [Desulfobacterales bacterium]
YAGWAAGQTSIIVVAGYADVTFGAATGYTAQTQVNRTTGMRARIYHRNLDGSEGTNVSITGATANANLGFMLGFAGADVVSATPFEGYASSSGDVSGGLVTSPATTTTGVDRLLLRIYTDEQGVLSSPPATWTERFDNFETIISAITGAADTKELAAAGTEAATSRSYGGGDGTTYVCFGLALVPNPLTFVDSPPPPRRWPRIRMIGI